MAIIKIKQTLSSSLTPAMFQVLWHMRWWLLSWAVYIWSISINAGFDGWRSTAQVQFSTCYLSAQMQAPFGFYLLVLSTLKNVFKLILEKKGKG